MKLKQELRIYSLGRIPTRSRRSRAESEEKPEKASRSRGKPLTTESASRHLSRTTRDRTAERILGDVDAVAGGQSSLL